MNISIYTDGSSKGNPGKGGYGIVLLSGSHRKEFSCGYKLTTNNRMELLAVIVGLEAIKNKSNQNIDIQKFFVREDEVGKLTKSIDEMTKELQKRTKRAETFSTDLAHEIRNPLASLKGASELLDKTDNQKDKSKLFEIKRPSMCLEVLFIFVFCPIKNFF